VENRRKASFFKGFAREKERYFELRQILNFYCDFDSASLRNFSDFDVDADNFLLINFVEL